MRLWHYKLIPYLPKSQLLAQWRELNSFFAKQDKHILINYIYRYDKEYLRTYAWDVINEMLKRGYKVNTMDHAARYFGEMTFQECDESKRFAEHNHRYLQQCFFNLQEKFDMGQADFSEDEYDRLSKFLIKEIRG